MSDNEGNFKLFAATYLSFSATIFLPRTVLTLVKHSTGLHSKERFEEIKIQQTQTEKKSTISKINKIWKKCTMTSFVNKIIAYMIN